MSYIKVYATSTLRWVSSFSLHLRLHLLLPTAPQQPTFRLSLQPQTDPPLQPIILLPIHHPRQMHGIEIARVERRGEVDEVDGERGEGTDGGALRVWEVGWSVNGSER